jgi:hypothetical protein
LSTWTRATERTRSGRVSTARKASSTVSAFYEALSGDALELNAFSYSLEKLDKNAFTEFLAGARALMAEKLRSDPSGGNNGPDAARMMKTVRVLNRAREYFDNNVSLVHIAGMICAELIEPD